MDLKGYEVKNTTICDCGYEFNIYDMKRLQRIPDNKFYGGVVRHIDKIKCPKCSKETLLLIKQQGQTYIVKDIAQKDNKTAQESTMIVTDKENNSSNEIICPVCQRAFKTKAGLTNHIKTHNN